MLQFPNALTVPASPDPSGPLGFGDHVPPPLAPILLRAVMRRWWLVLLCGVLFLGLGVALSALWPPAFTATATIVVDPLDINLLQNELAPRQPSADSGVSITETEARVIASDSVLRRVVDTLRLQDDPSFYKRASWRNGGLLEDTMLFLGASTPDGDADPALVALDTLRHAVTVRRAERTYVIDVLVKAADPARAAEVANAVTDAYLAEKAAAHFDVASRASGALKGRLDQLLDAARQAEAKAVVFRDTNNLMTAGGHLMVDQQVTELTTQLSAAQARVAEARGRLDQAAGTSQPEIMQSVDVHALRQQLADLTRSEADLQSRVGANHPAMRQIQAQIASITASLQAATARVSSVNRDEYERAAANEAAVSKSLQQLRGVMAQNEQAITKLRELERDADSRRSVYEAFLSRSRETGEQERLDTSNARVISAAVAPRKRSFPPSPMVLLPGSMVLGLGFGAMLAALAGAPAARPRAAATPVETRSVVLAHRAGEAA